MQSILNDFSDRNQEIIAEFCEALLGKPDPRNSYNNCMSKEDVWEVISIGGYGLNLDEWTKWCWITREGKVYTCQWAGHARMLRYLGMEEYAAEELGWTKVTVSGVYCQYRKTAAQIRVLQTIGIETDKEQERIKPPWIANKQH